MADSTHSPASTSGSRESSQTPSSSVITTHTGSSDVSPTTPPSSSSLSRSSSTSRSTSSLMTRALNNSYPNINISTLSTTVIDDDGDFDGGGLGATGTIGAKPDYSEAKIVVAMVGLPARGKSYLSNKLMRYLRVSTCSSLVNQPNSQAHIECTHPSGLNTRSKSST